jgi:hypothetical protein
MKMLPRFYTHGIVIIMEKKQTQLSA